ncbi:MAG TPA: AI-2E family transporter [Candidatus Paceibacterota bacterium]|nr:AI-2E family transporter [Candidatus Paceibacterota bacterium]
MDKEIQISITPGTIITAIAIVVSAYVLWVLRGLVLLVITAVVIASAIEPGVAFFIRHRIHRFVAVLLTYVLVFGSLFCLLYFFFPPILADAGTFFANIPQYLDTLTVPASFSGLSSATDILNSQHQAQSVVETLLTLQTAFTSSSAGILQLISAFFGGIFSLFLVIVFSFYLALQETGVDDFLRLVIPAKQEDYAVDLWRRSQKKIGLWMQGQILLSVIVGILVYLGLLIIGIPYALLLAVFTAMAEIIPIFGSLVAGTAAVIVAFSQGGVALAAIVAGLYVVVNQFETNLIYPLVVKKVIGLPPLIVILALIAGDILGGFVGILLSVPIAAALLEFVSDLEKRKRRIAGVST